MYWREAIYPRKSEVVEDIKDCWTNQGSTLRSDLFLAEVREMVDAVHNLFVYTNETRKFLSVA